jgi:flagellar hook-length control protein FliK
MTNLPIAAPVPAPTAVKRAPANALQQNAGLPGAAQTDESSFHDALLQMLGKGLGNAFSAAGTAAVASSKADSSRKTEVETDPVLDASALTDALALPQWFASALAPAATRPVGLSTVLASAKAALDPQTGADTTPVLDSIGLTDALALPQGLASALAPAATRPVGLSTVLASAKAALDPQTGADTTPVLDASALTDALALPQGFASLLAPAATRPVGMSSVLASSKAALAPQTGADTPAVLDASVRPEGALPAGTVSPHLNPKAAPANALLALAPEPLKETVAAPVFETASSRTEAPVAFSIAAQAIETGSSTPTRGVPEPSAAVQTRVGERAWDQAVGEKLVWMVNQKHQVAQLHLNPPELGPLKISISLDQNQASAQFFSAHASVREALETAMPRLREMLADSGITLGNASVGTEAFREPAQQQPRTHVAQAGVVAADSGTVASGERLLRPMLGLVDTFA